MNKHNIRHVTQYQSATTCYASEQSNGAWHTSEGRAMESKRGFSKLRECGVTFDVIDER
jgi:hypothetical protein